MSSCWRIATFHDMWPEVEMGVKRIPYEIYLVYWGMCFEVCGRTFEADSVALQTVHSLLEERLSCRRHARHIVLVPLDRCVHVFEYFFDGVGDLSANTVTRNECNLLQIGEHK